MFQEQQASTIDSMGSINIVTKNNLNNQAHLQKVQDAKDRVARVVDLNKNTSFPLNT